MIKDVEIRVTVVGDKVFAAEIHSQVNEEAKYDWRTVSPRKIPHFVHKLPDEIETACVALTTMLGLNFSAIDLIKKPDGEYIFLEINSNGQWLWIEDITGLKIADAIAEALMFHDIQRSAK